MSANKMMQDMVPPDNNDNDSEEKDVQPERRSIRNVPLPETKRNSKHSSAAVNGTTETSQKPPQEPRRPGYEVPRWGVWSIAIISIVVVTFAVSTLFTSATVVISPQQRTESVDLSVTATQNTTEGLSFETVTLTLEETETVTAAGSESVETKAAGKITVFNEYSEDPMTLVATTRFEAENGQIYRSPEAVHLPGKAEDGTPGQVTITVHSEKTGESYNRTEGEFTLPGLEGDPSFDEVYARVSSPIEGGAQGEQKIVPDAQKDRIRNDLRSSVEESLTSRISGEVPEGYVTFRGLIDISHGPLRQSDAGGDSALFTVSSTAAVPVFPEVPLTKRIAESVLDDMKEGERVRISNLASLSFVTDVPFREGVNELTGTVTGDAEFIWEIDEEAVKKQLSGKHKSQLGSALTGIAGIEEAKAHLQPFWIRSFPSDPSDISIETTVGLAEER